MRQRTADPCGMKKKRRHSDLSPPSIALIAGTLQARVPRNILASVTRRKRLIPPELKTHGGKG